MTDQPYFSSGVALEHTASDNGSADAQTDSTSVRHTLQEGLILGSDPSVSGEEIRWFAAAGSDHTAIFESTTEVVN